MGCSLSSSSDRTNAIVSWLMSAVVNERGSCWKVGANFKDMHSYKGYNLRKSNFVIGAVS